MRASVACDGQVSDNPKHLPTLETDSCTVIHSTTQPFAFDRGRPLERRAQTLHPGAMPETASAAGLLTAGTP